MADDDFLGSMFQDGGTPALVPEATVADVIPADGNQGPDTTPVTAPPIPDVPDVDNTAPVVAPTPEAPKDEQRTIPLATALNWRDEAKEYKRRVEAFESQQRQNITTPDVFDDPEGYAAHQQSLVQQAIVTDRFERSNEDAIEKYGEDKVKAAVDWATARAQQNPTFATEYMGKTRPIHWIVQQHQRDAMLSEIGDNPDDYFAREAAKRGYVLPSATPTEALSPIVQPAPKPVPPPRSIASDRSAAPAAVSPQGDREGFLASIVGK